MTPVNSAGSPVDLPHTYAVMYIYYTSLQYSEYEVQLQQELGPRGADGSRVQSLLLSLSGCGHTWLAVSEL